MPIRHIYKKERNGQMQWRTLEANRARETMEFIMKNYQGLVFTASHLVQDLGMTRASAIALLNRLHKSNFLRKRAKTKRKLKDSRVYAIGKKALTRLPRKKPHVKPKQEVIEKIVEKPVERKQSRVVRPVGRI